MTECNFYYFKDTGKIQISTVETTPSKRVRLDYVTIKENKKEVIFTMYSNSEDFATIEEVVKKEAYVYFFNKGSKGEVACQKILGYLR